MKCCLCGAEIFDYGNNPWPLNQNEDDRCCDICNEVYVIPARIGQMLDRAEKKGNNKNGKCK